MTFHLGIEAVPSKQKLLEQVIRFYTVSSSLRRSRTAARASRRSALA
jgi:hypothetical protein